MKVLFDETIARSYDRWAETPSGRKAYALEGELLVKLGDLAADQAVLEVGCGTGLHLSLLFREGMNIMGADISPHMLRVARERLNDRVQLVVADAGDLPFRDRSFDCVALIATLEFVGDPVRTVREALRVSRGKVLFGVLNKYSFLGLKRRVRAIVRPSIFGRARFYSIWELKRLIATAVPEANVHWASILLLPMSMQAFLARLVRPLSFRRNPLGDFLGLVIMPRGVNSVKSCT